MPPPVCLWFFQLCVGFSARKDKFIATIPITKIGSEKIKAELRQLKTVDRPWVINAISEARAQRDLSENAEYEAANG